MEDATLPGAIRTALQCKACHKYLRPPIRICKNGHNVCDLCKTARGSSCPVCNDIIMDTTNIELEALIKHFKAPISCKFNGEGCTETKDLDEILCHEEDCLFRSTKCLIVDCKSDITLKELENHMEEKHQELKNGKWVIKKSRSDMDLQEMEKLMIEGVSVVRGRDWNYGNQDGNPPGTGVIFAPLGAAGYPPGVVGVKWNNGKQLSYRMGLEGLYEVKLAPSMNDYPFAIRTWRHSDVRFFATLFIGSDDFWHVMVSAACGKNKAAKFRADIRLSSSSIPECSNVYHRPVEHLDSEIDLSSMKTYIACLDVHKEDVAKQTVGKINNLKVAPEDIPFTCHVYDKVFVTLNKEDIDEKED